MPGVCAISPMFTVCHDDLNRILRFFPAAVVAFLSRASTAYWQPVAAVMPAAPSVERNVRRSIEILPGIVEPLITSQDHIDPFNKTA